jgi:hypothetical protein
MSAPSASTAICATGAASNALSRTSDPASEARSTLIGGDVKSSRSRSVGRPTLANTRRLRLSGLKRSECVTSISDRPRYR